MSQNEPLKIIDFIQSKEVAQQVADEILAKFGVKAKKKSTKLTREQKLRYCAGCVNNYYNEGNHSNIGECWNLKSAKLVEKKRVHISQEPPWKQNAMHVLNCYNEQGYVFVDKDAEQ